MLHQWIQSHLVCSLCLWHYSVIQITWLKFKVQTCGVDTGVKIKQENKWKKGNKRKSSYDLQSVTVDALWNLRAKGSGDKMTDV